MSHIAHFRKLLSSGSTDGEIFLRKFFLLCHLGTLRINGQWPNSKFFLADYLADNKRVLIDWRYISEKNKRKLKEWLFFMQQATMCSRFSANARVGHINSVPEEKPLGPIAQFFNSYLFKNQFYGWNLSCDLLDTNYQLSQINYCLSDNAVLVELVPFFNLIHPENDTLLDEYSTDENTYNVKRVTLYDKDVERLLKTDLSTLPVEELLAPHPDSITVNYSDLRKKRMQAYRESHQFRHNLPWYSRWRIVFVRWVKNVFTVIKKKAVELVLPPDKKKTKPKPQHLFCLCNGTLRLDIDSVTGEVYLEEKAPDKDTFVFCGGGAKLFGHIGAIYYLKERGLFAAHFAGSSAGAIMALALYLGYEKEELLSVFSWFRQENLIDFEATFKGLSSTKKMEVALKWLVKNKVMQIIEKNKTYFITDEGKQFLKKLLSHQVITFRLLAELRHRLPDCGIGGSLSVTATEVKDGEVKTGRSVVFSTNNAKDKNKEVSKMVAISASLPFVYKPTELDGKTYTDGGVKTNLPLGLFNDNQDTVIAHEGNVPFNVLAFQFDNGDEGDNLYESPWKKVYKENFLLRWFYHFITGVKSAVAGWVKDRILMRVFAQDIIVIDPNGISASTFDLDEASRKILLNSGEKAAKNYFEHHHYTEYGSTSGNKEKAEREEALSDSFENLEVLFRHMAKRHKWQALEELNAQLQALITPNEDDKITPLKGGLTKVYINKLNKLYLALHRQKKEENKSKHCFSEQKFMDNHQKTLQLGNSFYQLKLFNSLFPILAQDWMMLARYDKTDAVLDALCRHRNRLAEEPVVTVFSSLEKTLKAHRGKMHLLAYYFKQLILHCESSNLFAVSERMGKLIALFHDKKFKQKINDNKFYDNWVLDLAQCDATLSLLLNSSFKHTLKKQDVAPIAKVSGSTNDIPFTCTP